MIPVDSSWTTSGINFGSNHVKQLIPPKIAIAWDVPTFSYAAGNTRYVIEREFGYPTTPVRTRHLAAPQLDHFDVLILPDGAGYGSILGKRGRDNLKAWVKDGGTMITMGRATRLLMKEGLDLMATRLEARGEVEDEKKKKTDQPKLSPATFIDSVQDYDDLLRTVTTKPDSLPGVLLKGEINQDHWLGGGVADTVNLMVTGDDIYTPLLEGTGTNLVKFLAEDEILVSGYMWEENRGQLAHKPAVMTREVGRGQVIGFTTDPAFRGYLYGLNVLLANAIFKAPAHVDTH